MTDVKVRPLSAGDRAAWEELYAGYASFYRVEQTAAMRGKVWGWITDPAHEVEGLVALNSAGALVGFAHFRPFARPLSATIGGYLDDLFVLPLARGEGVAQVLIDAVAAIGRERSWSVIRWITAEDNYRARSVYDRRAVRTPWVTYDLKLT